ncbi:MAG: extracellular solute-binding protein [Limnochordia bacterium]|nr:extracellular solute-binding protein [Limnochordia bacterium]MDD4519123.1 extracellular solute-binding protein [Limnochordia bacterium]
MIEVFEARNPYIKINLNTIDPSIYYDRLAMSMAGSAGPDVFYLHDSKAAPYHYRGYTLDLEPFIAESGIERHDLWPAQIEAMSLDGNLHGLPFDMSVIALYYNERVFNEAGVGYPSSEWTWDNLFEAGRKFATGNNEEQNIGTSEPAKRR